jgi:hypothetical protein
LDAWEVSTKRGFGPMEGDLSYTMTERDSSLQNCTIRCNRIALPECIFLPSHAWTKPATSSKLSRLERGMLFSVHFFLW